ncbi:MAG: hypothetical protein GY723_00200 [bacterium]|nr:hypothetical protein [bacterium]MCP5065847.1 hypothetical protein [bacterium]
MEALAVARIIHVLGVVLWIGGVALVTTVLLPAVRSFPEDENPVELFERIERRFALQARIITLLTGMSGLYLVHGLGAWRRYLSVESWWLHAMTAVWLIFTILLFVLEPRVLHRKLRERGERDPYGTLALIQRGHWLLLSLSLIAVAGAVGGSHGLTFW